VVSLVARVNTACVCVGTFVLQLVQNTCNVRVTIVTQNVVLCCEKKEAGSIIVIEDSRRERRREECVNVYISFFGFDQQKRGRHVFGVFEERVQREPVFR